MGNRSKAELARTNTFILAGGIGRRLLPLTESRPKPAVSFGRNFRIIDFTLSNCLRSGLGPVSVLTQYKHEHLHRHIRQHWTNRWNAMPPGRLRCVAPVNGEQYRGTADALFRNIASVDSRSDLVLVLSGDHVYHMDYRDLLRQHVVTNADLTIATTRYPRHAACDFGVVIVDERSRITDFQEKPAMPVPLPSDPHVSLVSMGIYVFKKAVLRDALSAVCGSGSGFDFAKDIIPLLIHSVQTGAYDFRLRDGDQPGYWRDIGTIDAYYNASMDLLGADRAFDPYAMGAFSPEVTADEPRVSATAFVRNTILSAGVEVEEGAVVVDSVVLPGARIGKHAQIRHAIVEEGVRVPDEHRAGFDLEYDRSKHSVSENGVVVITSRRTASTRMSTRPDKRRNHADTRERSGSTAIQNVSNSIV